MREMDADASWEGLTQRIGKEVLITNHSGAHT